MNNLGSILSKKEYKPADNSARGVNVAWEQATEFGEYVGIPTVAVLRLFKNYGAEKVLGLKGWIKDAPCDPKKGGKMALLSWKLKQSTKN